MEWLTVVGGVGIAALLGLAAAWLVARSRVNRALDHRIHVDDKDLTLPEVVWTLLRNGVDPNVKQLLTDPPMTRTRSLLAYLSEPVELGRLHDEVEALDAELASIRTSTEELPPSAVAFDVAAITLGGLVTADPEKFQVTLEAMGNVADTVVALKLDGLPVSDAVGDFVGEGVAALGGEGVAEALGFGIPLGSLWAGGRRLKRGMDQGLDGGRLAENAGLDLGVQGGGAVAGGTIGTFVIPVPVVGTAIGAAVGGILGSKTAKTVRRRHLVRARSEWMKHLGKVGLSVDANDFRRLVAKAERSQAIKEQARIALGHPDLRPGWSVWPTYRNMFLRRVGDAADRDVERARTISSNVRGAIRKMALAPPKVRALYWLDLGDQKEGLDLTDLLGSAVNYRRERDIAQALG